MLKQTILALFMALTVYGYDDDGTGVFTPFCNVVQSFCIDLDKVLRMDVDNMEESLAEMGITDAKSFADEYLMVDVNKVIEELTGMKVDIWKIVELKFFTSLAPMNQTISCPIVDLFGLGIPKSKR